MRLPITVGCRGSGCRLGHSISCRIGTLSKQTNKQKHPHCNSQSVRSEEGKLCAVSSLRRRQPHTVRPDTPPCGKKGKKTPRGLAVTEQCLDNSCWNQRSGLVPGVGGHSGGGGGRGGGGADGVVDRPAPPPDSRPSVGQGRSGHRIRERGH